MREICESLADLLEAKNEDYDSAFKKSIEKFGPDALLIHLYEKLWRLENLLIGYQANFESIDDTLMDIAGYAILALAERKED